MKKYFYLAAVSAMMLTACSSDKDVLEPKTGPAVQEITQQAVGFDVYVPNAAAGTRAGYEGVITTSRLQGDAGGFGVFGYYSDASTYPTSGYVPNFMYNENVTWNSTNKGWTYSPLKYWPNETTNDSQSNPATMTNLDQLTFFAYAPYVSAGGGTEGIVAITDNTGKLTGSTRSASDPLVYYKTAASCEDAVDLLWGVAPVGGLYYTAVNGVTNGAADGMPYLNLTKPDVNTSLKFNFQHALARFGFTVAAAIDQVPQGGGPLDDATTITVDQVKLTGYFSNNGILNLNNSIPNVANWINIGGAADLATGDVLGTQITPTSIILKGDIADDIEDSHTDALQTVEGVTTAKKELLTPVRYNLVKDPTTFIAGDKYYTSAGVELYADLKSTIATTYYYKDGDDYKKVTNSAQYPTTYYTITEGSVMTADPTTAGTYDIYKKVSNDFIYQTTYVYGTSAATGFDYSSNDYYTFTPTTTDAVTTASFEWDTSKDYYKPERSYLMVIPTNNIPKICTTSIAANPASLTALKTVTVEITYYVTTEDTKLSGGKSRIKNVISKDVELPSLDNGKSYNLHLLLGLTSVKIEAEVSDWKEIFVQTDLPQNTPGE